MKKEMPDILNGIKSFVEAIADSRFQKKMEEMRQQEISEKPFLNLDETCKFTGLSKSTIYSYVNEGKISFYKPTGKNLYFKKADLISFIMDERHYYRSRKTLEREAETMYIKDTI